MFLSIVRARSAEQSGINAKTKKVIIRKNIFINVIPFESQNYEKCNLKTGNKL